MDTDFLDLYWEAEDGRLFGSQAMGVIPQDDPAYQAWRDSGLRPRSWPRDIEGEQTQEALDEVLVARGLKTPPQPILTYKLDFYRRMTDDEADAVEMALASAKVRDRRMFEEAQVLNHADEDFARLHQTVVGMFGQPRADELLAPSATA